MIGTIARVNYTRGSGLATLVLLDEVGDAQVVDAEAGQLFRALEATEAGIGLAINYEMTDFGTMAWLNPIGEPK